MGRRLAWIPVLAAAAIVGACGSSGKEPFASGDSAHDRVAAVIADLGRSARGRDGDRICQTLFTSNLRISIARASHRTCPREVGANIFDSRTSFHVQSIQVDGQTATASVKDQDGRVSHLVLRSDGDTWRIARIG
jgi:hypothetical protein